ncbi:MAG: cytochrome ubiquinol oxidase subunit I [Holophagales bacterium]|nr:cytochrome ubiquinol oxidase subunit I [Holophagales bacterium]MBK9967021.1 cytochrome ubiquinol oxidase subunit I [Holophagales bacterium]
MREFAAGGGVLIAVVAILHVVVSHFAVGGGLVMAVLEGAAVKRNDRPLRDLVKRSSTILLLLSTVFGAISGVGIWFTIGVVHPAATSSLIHTFVWAWATEWAFFLLEVVTALAWVATWEKVSPRTHLLLIRLYAFAAFMSLVVIQGILGFMLTPGRFPKTLSVQDGFLNPTYLPGILFRTGVCILLGAAWMAFAALLEPDREARARLSRILASAGALGLGIAGIGWFVWERALPASVQRLFLGEKPLLATLATGRAHTLRMLVAAALLVLLVLLLPKLQSWPVAILALLAGAGILAGYERVREGVRKPFVIAEQMFSNGVLVSEIDSLNEKGVLSKAVWATKEAGGRTVPRGEAVFRAECSSCHTRDGYLGIRRLASAMDADLAEMFLTAMREDGEAWKARAAGKDAKPGYPFMPPFVGTDEELKALALWLASLNAPAVAEGTHAR